MKVSDLIEKLKKVKDQNAIVVLCDHKGNEYGFSQDFDTYEQQLLADDISWDDGDGDKPSWLPVVFNAVLIDS